MGHEANQRPNVKNLLIWPWFEGCLFRNKSLLPIAPVQNDRSSIRVEENCTLCAIS